MSKRIYPFFAAAGRCRKKKQEALKYLQDNKERLTTETHELKKDKRQKIEKMLSLKQVFEQHTACGCKINLQPDLLNYINSINSATAQTGQSGADAD